MAQPHNGLLYSHLKKKKEEALCIDAVISKMYFK